MAATRTLRIDLEYDGAGFSGWAAQPGRRTVEDVLGAALAILLGDPHDLRVAGRTDAGVHATGQVASVRTTSPMPARRLLQGLAGVLPADVTARAVAEAPDRFDARADALARSYEYRVLTGPPSPLRRTRVLHHHGAPLDVAGMHAAAALVVGTHDFRAFTPSVTQHTFFHRTVTRCAWHERGDELVLAVEADAFLRHMVRILAGTLLMVGRRHWAPARVGELLGGAMRALAGPTAPPHALTLVGVRYPPGW